MSKLFLSLLGPFRATLGDRELEKFRTNKVQALLVYLAVEGGAAHRREALMELLWPGLPLKSAQVNLRQTLYQLRRAIPKVTAKEGGGLVPLVLSDRQTVQFNPGADVQLDVARFMRLLSEKPTLARLAGAAALYRGDFLGDFFLPDSAEFEDWAGARRAEFRRQVLDALESLMAFHIEEGNYDQAQTYAWRALEIDDLRETVYRALMTVLALDGQREAALVQYQLCRERLQADLGIEPTTETMALAEKIRAGELEAEPKAESKGEPQVGPAASVSALGTVRGYDLLERIGAGGFGEVYRAHQSTVNRVVAMKVILPQFADHPEFVRRFEEEARLVARLEHPHIVPLFDYWRDADGAYLVMRWLEGGNLHDALQHGPWTPEAASQLLDQIAGALAVAHRAGVVHRDIKPENILLDLDGNAYLSDFGIAKDLMQDASLTAPDVVPGSVWYISPEQAQSQPVTPQSDLYSLGLVVYQVLTGAHPFSSLTPGEQLVRRLTEPLPALRDAALDEVLQRVTSRDPAERYPDAAAFARAFREALAGTAVDVAAVGPLPAVGAAVPPRLRHNLPSQPTPFIGREDELADLDELIADPDVRLITIVGPGGMGKTRLALAAAERQLTQSSRSEGVTVSRFSNGAFFVPLAALSASDQIVPAVAEALVFQLGGGEGESRTPVQQVLDYVRERRMLLVLDNFEHLLDAPTPANAVGFVTDFLLAAPQAQVLVTSRQRLHLHEEQVYPIRGLKFPAWERPEDTADYTAAQLFLQSARRGQPGFELTGDDLTYLARICRLVEGMPLGIELAAGWVDVLSLADIATEIQSSLDFMETALRDVPERHRSMHAVFDASWARLGEPEQGVFVRSCVFRGGFTRQAARAVADADVRTLSTLANKSLLYFDRERDRYELHELLRQYGEERLEADADAEVDVRDRHSDYYCAAMQKWGSDLRNVRQIAALAEIEADTENVRAAWEWALAQRDVGRLDGVLDGLCHFYTLRLRFQEGQAVCHLATDGLADGQPVVPGDAGRVLARLLVWQAVFDGELGHRDRAGRSLKRSHELLTEAALAGQDIRREKAFLLSFQGLYAFPDFEQGRRLMTESLTIYRSLDDQWQVARALLNVALATDLSGDLDTARQMYEESLTSFQTVGDQFFAVRALITLAKSARRLGVHDEAERRIKESLALSQAHGDYVGVAFSLEQLGYLALFQGQFAVGREYLQRCIAAYRERGYRLMEVVALANLGAAYWLSGEFDQARAPIAAGREIAEQTASLNNPAIVATYQAKLKMYVGKYDEARTEAQKALSAANELHSWFLLGRSHGILGWVALAQERYGPATQSLEESLKSWRIEGDREYEAWALTGLGRAAYGSGNEVKAQAHLLEGLEIVVEIRAFIMLLHLMPVIPLLLVESDQPNLKIRAVELYALATSHPFVAGARLFEDIAGRHVRDAAAAALAPDALAAAETRGRDRDWWETADELLVRLRQLGWAG